MSAGAQNLLSIGGNLSVKFAATVKTLGRLEHVHLRPVKPSRLRRSSSPSRVLLTVAALTIAALAASSARAAAADVDAAAQTSPPASRPRRLRDLVDAGPRIEVQGRLIQFALHGLDPLRHACRPLRLHRRRGRPVAVRLPRGAPGLRGRPHASRRREPRGVDGDGTAARARPDPHPGRARARRRQGRRRRDAPLVFKGRHWQLTTDAYRDAFLRVRDRWSTQPQLLERLAVDPRPRAVELVHHRRGHRAVRGDLRLDRALLAGGQVSPRRHRGRSARRCSPNCWRSTGARGSRPWPPIRTSTSPTPTRSSS